MATSSLISLATLSAVRSCRTSIAMLSTTPTVDA